MPPSPPTEQEWHVERMRNYLRISSKVQDLQTELRAAETAIRALETTRPNIDVNAAASSIFDYNFAHADATRMDLGSITDLNTAREAFEQSQTQAKEI